ncbi:putative signaling protein [Caenibius tardaugens NBRC 16725]|uniref:Putative signaling protein n=1 Tax=Caenibius tardaugens NBRC 16725 TaxID=1219035 RepID=U2YND8_9SPHN|nr:putative signaling protein [Caenibius tardaugens NBRC 16725]
MCAIRASSSPVWGGDEFALFLSGQVSADRLKRFGEQLCEALRVPFSLGDTPVQISGSLGFASYPDHGTTAAQLYEFADYALYHGKRHRRGGVSVFDTNHSTQMQQDATIEIALRKADLERELSIMFQPIVDVTTGETVAFEALARWKSTHLGEVMPDQFIRIAERGGLINRLTVILLGKALAAAEEWPEDIHLSFNLSAHDLCSPDVMLQIIKLVSEANIDPRRIDLEITETALLHDINQVREAIRMLKFLGCSVSLDDFGTGYSSLSHIHALPFTKIKIDRSFVQAMNTNPASYKIIKSLLALSRDMGIDCVIEGVETEDEMRLLRQLGGNIVQGYYFSAPIHQDMIGAYLGACGLEPVRHHVLMSGT